MTDTPALRARAAKTAMVASLGIFGLLVAFNNVTDYGSNFAFVRHVLLMDTTFAGNALRWRAINAPLLWHLFYALIIACEFATGVLFCLAAWSMARAIRGDAGTFRRARSLVPVATALGFLLWFFGFSVVGGEWFVMWQSHDWNGQQPAFRFYMTMLAVCIFVQAPE
ncbi:DUF2165 family protein [Tanticharoenia sakaeratensis]|uniref:Small integral membrane protein n=1 Tax=Tanticharoenia sakaeratensis NBRC 103193 TaxID=1231623 RepID=A0A0D6ML09_9PROT|nr:DUF2165 domain-containing protein [Tanticharoenia sakaeratensis]GAN54344.1 hypothetical protein Tasa_019_029 [Tanticharoenia sakaeratensis NBRC 103193]GBQ18886.1 hypothetical protein AA103193_0843 [Tanticharoenia sakaeratensis NBRC 103193]